MKNTSIKLILVIITSVILTNYCKVEFKKNYYLLKVLDNLERIKSASYFSERTVNTPGDTNTLHTHYEFRKEFVNPVDTFIGSTFARFDNNDTSKMFFCYDGNAKIMIDRDFKTIEIDSFKTNDLPFRIGEPFFRQARSIIEYALETNDSII